MIRRSFVTTSRPRLDAELAEFWRANPPTRDLQSPVPNHHWFHYTDVPMLNRQKYADGKTGRSQWDIVQTMKLCISVLQGEVPEDNPRKITKTVAVILLAHFVGDIHQPLHVGAQYFDAKGNPVDPDKAGHGFDNHGGNTIRFNFSPAAAEATGHKHAKLHGFWDTRAVLLLLPQIPKELPKEEKKAKSMAARRGLALQLAKAEPKDWRAAGEPAAGRLSGALGERNPADGAGGVRTPAVQRDRADGERWTHGGRRECAGESDAGWRSVSCVVIAGDPDRAA